MNIIEAIQQAESGKLIRNGMLKRIDHFLKYMGNGIFYEYELIPPNAKSLVSTKRYKYERQDFSVGYILSTDWEIFDGDSLFDK